MSKGERLQRILNDAEGKEKKYGWLEAAELYGQALGLAGKPGFLQRGETQEKIGYCFRRGAMQAQTREEFKERMQRAAAAYEEARGFYESLADELKTARIFRCNATIKYLGYWLASEPSEQRGLLDECIELEGNALQAFSETGDMLEYGRTYGALPHLFWLRARLEWSGRVIERIYRRGVKWGETAVATLAAREAFTDLAQAYYTLATCLTGINAFIAEPEEQDKNFSTTVEHLRKALDLAERAGNVLFAGLAICELAGRASGPEEGRKKAEEALRYGEKMRDNLLIAWSLSTLAIWASVQALSEEDPAKWKELMDETFQFYDRAHRLYSSIPIPSPAGGFVDFPHGWLTYYSQMAEREVVLERRLDFLTKAEAAGAEALQVAESSDSPEYTQITLAYLGGTQMDRAEIDADLAEKRRRLESALKMKERVCQIREETWPFALQPRGVGLTRLAVAKMYLADVEPDREAKQRLLEEASLDMENGLTLYDKATPLFEKRDVLFIFALLYRDQDLYAALLTRLYHETHKPDYLRKAVAISEKAIHSARKLDMVSRTAESYWKIAKAQDLLGDQLDAAASFQHASQSYKKAAEKIPQLTGLYHDHASYMEAWSEIERARHHHKHGQYGRAKEHYEKASNLHKAVGRWNYLSLNYAALASVEGAEDLSRKGQAEEAKALFEHAATQFAEAKASIKSKLDMIESQEEKETATQLAKASDSRRDYCRGRTLLEEGKILDMQGDHGASSKMYGAAAERFLQVADAAELESDRRELKPLVDLCRAWQTMTRAEAEASPDLYLEAARLFAEAKEHSLDEKSRMLALGHSSFCKALEAGARFEATRDMKVYSVSKRHMEAAENFYLKAGFTTASEYTKATLLLSDSYMYMHKAETAADPREKAQYYQMAEKLLQASAGSYMQAKHPEKSDQVQRLLEGAKEKRQLATSLAEVLHAPTITATTTSFSTPTPTHEQAAGLERFEHADVQANLILKVKEARVGENVGLAIELVNAGKAPALLIKVDEVTPAGFEIREVPEMYTFEDSYIDMKGKRLNPLKTEDVKVVVTPRSKGTHMIKPRILYIDETGKYKSHEPEPVTITVKELGISGWIKGEK